MTEAEAKTKTCLQTLAANSDAQGRMVYGPASCIASSCMAWRWSKRAYPEGKAQSTDRGFCGLAGRPE